MLKQLNEILLIVSYCLNLEKAETSYQIAKKLFKDGKKYKNKVKRILNLLYKYGILNKIEINGKHYFYIDPEKLSAGEFELKNITMNESFKIRGLLITLKEGNKNRYLFISY